jgi:protein involved in polysaccharide export with SLBB domain
MRHRLQVSQLLSLIPLIFVLVSVALTGCKAQSRRVDAPKSIEVRGAVRKPGGYIIKDGDTITIPKALELAGGLTVSPLNLRAVVRHEDGSTIFVNLRGMLVRKTPDIKLLPGDSVTFERVILFDPPLQGPNRRTSTTTS